MILHSCFPSVSSVCSVVSQRQGWLALVLSLGIHGTFLLAMLFWPATGQHHAAPLPIDTLVVVPDDQLTLTLALPPGAPPSRGAILVESSADARDAEPPEIIPVHVAEVSPVPTPDTSPALPQPRPEAGGSPGSSGNSAGGTGAGKGDGQALFHVPAPGQTVVYVIDRSASMWINGGLAAAKRELLASLERLPSTCRFQIILYNRTAEPLKINGLSGLLPPSAEVRAEIALQLDSLRAAGSTEHLPALRRALALSPDLLFFLTDADDLTVAQARAVTLWNRGRTAIHTIEWTTSRPSSDDRPLQVLARWNRGTCQVVGGE